jgi:ABC-2 type transport system ATP-binding protein
MPAEDRTLLLRQTARENLQFHGRLQGIREARLRQAVDDTLEAVGLGDMMDRVGFALSSGMRARLMLARAILHEPSVLILDEPTSSVDPIGSYQIIALIQQIAEERRVAVLLSSHRLDEIETLHHNILLLNRGKTLYWGNLDSLRSLWEKPPIEIHFDKDTAAQSAMLILEGMNSVHVTKSADLSLMVKSDLTVGNLLTALDGQVGGVVSIRRSEVRLQELLVRIVAEESQRGATN